MRISALPEGDEGAALTREEIWDQLPDEIRRNVKHSEAVLEESCGELWERKEAGGKAGGFRYWRKGNG